MQIPVTTSGRTPPYHANVRPRLLFLTAQKLRRLPFTFPFWGSLKIRRSPQNCIALLLVATSAFAQDPAILLNHGDPLLVGYPCVEEDLQWAGMSCNEDNPCPVYLEITAVASRGRKVLAAGNFHGTSATLSSILLQSDDGGATWKEQAARIRGDAIEQLQFFDADHAWAAGETQYPLARDPFVLMTADAARSWRERAIGEEGGAGSIQRLWFDSAAHGELIVDAGKAAPGGRYFAYESNDGGDTWTLRGSGDNVAAQRRGLGTEEPEWRVRTGKDGKDYTLEKRSGDAWESIASFLIEVANCKIDPGKTSEPKP
jgi:hypothetical protein